MSVARLLGCIAIAAAVTACSSQPPPPEVVDRIAYLENRGIAVDREKMNEIDKSLHFPLGECGAVLHYFDGVPRIDIYMKEGHSLETFYGDGIKNAGRTAATMVCNRDKVSTSSEPSSASPTSESW